MVKHTMKIKEILEEFFEGGWNGVSKKDFKESREVLSELNFDDVEPTYIREKSLCEKKSSKEALRVSEREHKNKSKKPLINE